MTSFPFSKLCRDESDGVPDFYLGVARVLWLSESCCRLLNVP